MKATELLPCRPLMAHQLAPFVALFVTCTAFAGNTWDGGGADSNWGTAGNWNPDGTPTYGTATFSGTTRTNPVLNVNYNMNQVNFASGGPWTLVGGAGTLSLFDNGGTQAKVENNGSSLVTISASITFAASSGSPFGEINAVSGDLLFSGGTLTVNGPSVNGIKFFGGSRVVTFNNTVSASGKWFGITTGGTGNTINIGGTFTSGDFYVMNDGTLNLTSGGSLTTSAIRLGGDFGNTGNQNQTKSGAFFLNSSAGGQVFSGTINPVTGNSSGTLTIGSANAAGTNTFSGGIFLDSSLRVTNTSGGTLIVSGPVSYQNASGGISRTLTVNGTGDIVIVGNLTNAADGGSALSKVNSGTLTLAGTNAIRVLYNHGGGVISISSAANIGIPLGVNFPDKFNFTANATLRSTNNITLGRQVSGTDNAGFRINGGSTATFEVLADSTLSIDGAIVQYGTGNGSLTKIGSGTLHLLAANTYAGTTTVSAGTLGGTGSLAGPLSINASGTLAPGTSIGTLTVNNTVTLAGTTALEVNKAAGPTLTSDLVTGITTLNCGGAVTVSATGNALAAGDEYTVFSAGSYNGSFTSITPAPGAGLAWDTNALPTLGKLRVHTIPVAVSNVASVAQGQSTTISAIKLLANDSDADSDPLTVVSAVAASGSASVSGGNVNYTAPLSGTSDTITYTISDGRGGTASASIHVTLTSGTSQGFNQLSLEPLGGGAVRLTYLGIPGTNYALDWRTNLTLGNWMPVITNPAAANGHLVFTNTSSEPENYFRTRHAP